MSSVEIFWPWDRTMQDLDGAVRELEAAGIETTCRLQPVRRSGENAVLVVVASTTLQPFLAALFQQLAAGSYRSLRGFVAQLLGRESSPDVRRTVVFESAGSGAQFVFTPDLPDVAYQQAIALDPGPEPGRWLWDAVAGSWQRFETIRGDGT